MPLFPGFHQFLIYPHTQFKKRGKITLDGAEHRHLWKYFLLLIPNPALLSATPVYSGVILQEQNLAHLTFCFIRIFVFVTAFYMASPKQNVNPTFMSKSWTRDVWMDLKIGKTSASRCNGCSTCKGRDYWACEKEQWTIKGEIQSEAVESWRKDFIAPVFNRSICQCSFCQGYSVQNYGCL